MKALRIFLLFATFIFLISTLVSAHPMADYRHGRTFADNSYYRTMHLTADDYYFHHQMYDSRPNAFSYHSRYDSRMYMYQYPSPMMFENQRYVNVRNTYPGYYW